MTWTRWPAMIRSQSLRLAAGKKSLQVVELLARASAELLTR